jgi:hypothetical protein
MTMPKKAEAARRRCYDEIVVCCKEGLARYYAEFAERLGDGRAKDALDWSLRGINRIHRILDQYEITERKTDAKAKDESTEGGE